MERRGGKECVKKTPLLISYLTKCHYPCSQALPSFLTLVFVCVESLGTRLKCHCLAYNKTLANQDMQQNVTYLSPKIMIFIDILLHIKWKVLCLIYKCGSPRQKSKIIALCVHFDWITAFKVLQHRTSVKGKTHTCYIDLSGIHASMLWLFSFIGTFQSFEHTLVPVCLDK